MLAAVMAFGCAAPPVVPVTFQPENLSCKVTSGRGIKGGMFAGEVLLSRRRSFDCNDEYKLYYALNIGDGNAGMLYSLADFSLRGVLVLERNGEIRGILALKPVTGCIALNGGTLSPACLKGTGRDGSWCGIAGNGPVSIAFSDPKMEFPEMTRVGMAILSTYVDFVTGQGDGSVRIDFQIAVEDVAVIKK